MGAREEESDAPEGVSLPKLLGGDPGDELVVVLAERADRPPYPALDLEADLGHYLRRGGAT